MLFRGVGVAPHIEKRQENADHPPMPKVATQAIGRVREVGMAQCARENGADDGTLGVEWGHLLSFSFVRCH
jgi:hypothetical protein